MRFHTAPPFFCFTLLQHQCVFLKVRMANRPHGFRTFVGHYTEVQRESGTTCRKCSRGSPVVTASRQDQQGEGKAQQPENSTVKFSTAFWVHHLAMAGRLYVEGGSKRYIPNKRLDNVYESYCGFLLFIFNKDLKCGENKPKEKKQSTEKHRGKTMTS